MTKRFQSFDDLKSANDVLQSTASGDRKGSERDIRDFLEAAVEAGASIAERDERRAAQDMLDYWFTQLLVTSEEDMTSVSPRLKQYGAQTEDARAGGKAGPMSDLERSRQIIRLGALARQWKMNKEASGYLLKGEALDTARKYRSDDPDIAALVDASENEERAAKKVRTRLVALGFALLTMITLAALWLAHEATVQKDVATQAVEEMKRSQEILAEVQAKAAQEEKAEAEAQLKAAKAAAEASEDARRRAEALGDQIKTDSEALLRQINELQKQQGVLDAALETIRKQLQSGNLRRADLPEAIAGLIKPEEVINIFKNPLVRLAGYDRAFLGVDIPLPSLSQSNRLVAFQAGRPLQYINYSLVLNQKRRMAFYTAVNMDRSSLRVLPRLPVRNAFSVENDPRIPPSAQVLRDWFIRPDVDIGHLATRAEISWGPAFDRSTLVAAQVLDDAVNVSTNVTPQFDSFNRGVWSALERWVLSQHNPQARQVTVFTGPVFANNDPIISGAQAPRAFWKIVVSAVSDFAQKDGSGYAVDAFLISQYKPGTNEKIARQDRFKLDDYRVPVAEIERLTGLSFAETIQSADRERNALLPQSLGDVLAAKAVALDGADAAQRKAAAQDLVSGLRNGVLPWSEQQKVIAALLAMAQGPSMEKLSATGRLNLLFVLSQVPAATWNLEEAVDIKATARQAVAELEARAAVKGTEIGTKTREHLALLERNIGYGQTSAQTVYLQFAGLTRSGAKEIGAQMRQLGWTIPGEERVEGIAMDEVRYNPADEADEKAARLLAGDLRAAGRTAVEAKPNTKVASGILEIRLRE